MKHIFLTAFVWVLGGLTLVGQTNTAPASSSKSIAVALVYDGSGSMAERVPGKDQRPTPKYRIANQAVNSIIDQLLAHSQDKHVEVQAGLVDFVDSRIQDAIPLATLDATQAAAFTNWTHKFRTPAGGTPLGLAIQGAQRQLAKSDCIHKHILVITDGMSNVGISPNQVVHNIHNSSNPIPIYFVAFDVSASVFDGVKSEGATVVSASDEAQLNVQINQILGQKILLEAE
jgi:hypothetical protein